MLTFEEFFDIIIEERKWWGLTLRCGVRECPWISPSGFCLKEFVFLNEGGACLWIYDRQGRVRNNWKEKGQEERKEVMNKDHSC